MAIRDSIRCMHNAAIFHELTRRNAIRKAAQLPLLDMRKEYDKEVNLAAWEDYWAVRETYAAKEADILASVLEEMRRTLGPHFPSGWMSRLGVRLELNKRMGAFLARKGILPPEFLGGTVYGSGRVRDQDKEAAPPPNPDPAA